MRVQGGRRGAFSDQDPHGRAAQSVPCAGDRHGPDPDMRPGDILLALTVVTIWGLNFVAIEIVLRELPPIFVTALRFVLVVIPAILFIRPPRVPWPLIAGYGAFMFAGQFVFLFTG